jgi:aminotransferase
MTLAPSFARSLAQRAVTWPVTLYASKPESGVIDLAQSYLTEPPPSHVALAAGEALDKGATHYVDRSGIKPLREAIVNLYEGRVSMDDIVVTSGAQEALFVTLRALLKPGDEVLVPDPGYWLIADTIRNAEGQTVFVPTAADAFQLSAGRLEAHLTPRTRFIILFSPNPATGLGISPTELANILALSHQHNLIVILDEALSLSPQPISDESLIRIGSLSKHYRMSGWRMGWVSAKPEWLGPIRDLKQALSICSPAVSQWAAVAALTGPRDWLTQQETDFAVRRDYALNALTRMGFAPIDSDETYFLFVDVRSTKLSSAGFVEFALREVQVRVMPGTHFGTEGEGWVRLSLNVPMEQLSVALNRLGQVLSKRR